MGTSQSIDRWTTQFAKISYFHREVINLNLIELKGQNYLECHEVYCHSTNQQAKMLDAMFIYFEKTFENRSSYSILSVGCGSGSFEVPLLEKLLAKNQKIHFVGIDSNKEQTLATQQKLDRLARENGNFSFEIFHEDFNSCSFKQCFDAILCIHVLYYCSNLESTLSKIRNILDSDSKLVVMNAPLEDMAIPYFCISNNLWGTVPWYSQEIEETFDICRIPYSKQAISASLDISTCFDSQLKRGKQLLDFILGVDTEYFSASQKQMFLDYLREISKTNPDAQITCPYPVNMLCVSKWN
jgi:SAM-dependent methyltransferase